MPTQAATERRVSFNARDVLGCHIYQELINASGGFKSCFTTCRSSEHTTAVVCVSVSGLKAPSFFVIERKRINNEWFDAVKGKATNGAVPGGLCGRFCLPNWVPAEKSVVKVIGKGSMEMDVLEALVKHLAKFIKSIVGNKEDPLTIDGHIQTNGVGWLEEFRHNTIIGVQAPTNTSPFLQP